jgi:hypothetical protein
VRSVLQFGHDAESYGGIVRSLASHRDFETEAGPQDCHAARQGGDSGFCDAEHSNAHH